MNPMSWRTRIIEQVRPQDAATQRNFVTYGCSGSSSDLDACSRYKRCCVQITEFVGCPKLDLVMPVRRSYRQRNLLMNATVWLGSSFPSPSVPNSQSIQNEIGDTVFKSIVGHYVETAYDRCLLPIPYSMQVPINRNHVPDGSGTASAIEVVL